MTKIIYSFHIDIVKKHIQELSKRNQTVIQSAFIFNLFSKMVDKDTYTYSKIHSNRKFYIAWSGTAGRKKYRNPNMKYILRLLENNHFDINQVKTLLENTWYSVPISIYYINQLFNKDTPEDKRLEILHKMNQGKCTFLSGFIGYKLYYHVQTKCI